MLERGYSLRHKRLYPTYKDVIVCDEWLTFSKFRAWMVEQEWVGNHLDKDFLGRNLYSPETSRFIPPFVNTSLSISNSIRGDLPLGVSKQPAAKGGFRYTAMIKNQRSLPIQKNLGSFDSPGEAHKAWQSTKIKILLIVLQDYEKTSCYDPDVGEALSGKIEKIRCELLSGKETKTV